MPRESSRDSKSSDKRKGKNKAPKRLRRKNKVNDLHTEENNTIPTIDRISIVKEKTAKGSATVSLNTSSTTIDAGSTVVSTEQLTIEYWRSCTKKALDILEKQASNRRKFFIERHQERIHSIQYLLSQREQLGQLTAENHTIRNSLHIKDETIKTLEEKLTDYNDLLHENDYLRVQCKSLEQKFDRFTIESNKKFDEHRQHEHEYNEQIQSLMDEIERIKRDLVLEEYRKQEAERKVRYYEEKTKIEQNLNKKLQHDLLQLKQDLKSIHMRYDSLQIEMLAMHQANQNDSSLVPTKDTTDDVEWTSKRDHIEDFERLETKRSKRKTRDRTDSSASDTIEQSSQLTVPIKRKTLKSKKTKAHLPMLTVTQASPGIDEDFLVENPSKQLLLPSSISATSDGNTATSDSQDTSCESQPMKVRTKKQSRYPCRRAQRPVKQIAINDEIKP